jgi:hypothetical protein
MPPEDKPIDFSATHGNTFAPPVAVHIEKAAPRGNSRFAHWLVNHSLGLLKSETQAAYLLVVVSIIANIIAIVIAIHPESGPDIQVLPAEMANTQFFAAA